MFGQEGFEPGCKNIHANSITYTIFKQNFYIYTFGLEKILDPTINRPS
jgi:hypothetical protein